MVPQSLISTCEFALSCCPEQALSPLSRQPTRCPFCTAKVTKGPRVKTELERNECYSSTGEPEQLNCCRTVPAAPWTLQDLLQHPHSGAAKAEFGL